MNMTDLMNDGANALLNQTSTRGIRWEEIGKGVWVTGKIKGHKVEQCTKWDPKGGPEGKGAWTNEPDSFDDGNPKMQIVIDWQTNLSDGPDDTGLRTMRSGYSKRDGSIIGAIRAALGAAGAPGLEHEADLGLCWSEGEGRTGDPRLFVGAYKRPVTQVPGNNGNGGGQVPANPFADNGVSSADI
jgi:hypothetical protein